MLVYSNCQKDMSDNCSSAFNAFISHDDDVVMLKVYGYMTWMAYFKLAKASFESLVVSWP